MNALVTFFLAASVSMSALAQEQQFLQKAEIEALANGKKWNIVRLTDQAKILYDIREGGTLYANNYTTNFNDSAQWSINNESQFCLKWRGKSPDSCSAIQKDGEKFKMFDSSNLKNATREFVVQ